MNKLFFSSLLLLGVNAASGAGPDRTAWFQEAKFGLFIHWGIYAVPAGIYRGNEVQRSPRHPGSGEWIMHDAQIPVAEYREYAAQFNPTQFNARQWVKIAQDAGMKYIVITAKHHDGFAMFRSQVSPFNIVDATPFGRDPLQELAAACQTAGIRLGFYYSQAQDWSHPGGAAWGHFGPMTGGDPAAGHWDPAQAGDFDHYLDDVAVPQVRELLGHYGPVAMLWWDTPIGMTPERASRFAPVLALQPQMLTNNRLLDPDQPNAYSGDTQTPEQVIPATGVKDRHFEVCMTMNDTWGYKAHDQNWKSADDIIRKLIDIASKGGNFLLNVGPTATGEFPAASIERLQACGRWTHLNQEALYGTTASRFRRLPWGRSTTKGNTLYLEVFDWPTDHRLVVPGIKSLVRRASLLVTGTRLAATSAGDQLVLALPDSAPDPVASVIKLEFDRPPVVDQPLPQQSPTGDVALPAALAAIVNSYTGNARLEGAGPEARIAHWDRAGISVSWDFQLDRSGRFAVEAEVKASGPAVIHFGGESAGQSSEPVAPSGDFAWIRLGVLALPQAGQHIVTLKSGEDRWHDLELRSVRLRWLAN